MRHHLAHHETVAGWRPSRGSRRLRQGRTAFKSFKKNKPNQNNSVGEAKKSIQEMGEARPNCKLPLHVRLSECSLGACEILSLSRWLNTKSAFRE